MKLDLSDYITLGAIVIVAVVIALILLTGCGGPDHNWIELGH
jgi:hypothetical protein